MHPIALLHRFLLPAALLLGVAQAHAGLVLHYKFDETSGATAADSSGNGNTGTLVGMTGNEWVTGKIDGALSFNPSSFDDRVEVMGYKGIAGSNARTFSFWLKTSMSSGDPSVKNPLMTYGNYTVNGDTMYLYLSNTGKLVADFLGFSVESGSGGLNNGAWRHVAMTLPTGGTSDDVKLYVDGSLATSGTGSNSINTGSSWDVTLANDTNFVFDGALDEVRFYNTALSASEISALASMSGDGGGAGAPEPAETFAFLGLLTAFGIGFREWRFRRKAKAA